MKLSDIQVQPQQPSGKRMKLSDIQAPSSEPAITPKTLSLSQKLHDAVFAPKSTQKGFGSASDAVTSIPSEIGRAFVSSAEQFGRDLSAPKNVSEISGNPIDTPTKLLGDVAGMALSPVTGAATSLIGRPVEAATGVRREIPAALATMLIPGAGETEAAKGMKTLEEAARAFDATAEPGELAAYGKAVKSLQDQGVKLTPGQLRGGLWRRFEEAHKSNPLVGQAIRDAENESITSFNRAAYNKVLSHVGEKYEGAAVGNEGIKAVGNKLSGLYEKLKPSLKLVPDDELIGDLSEARGSGWRMADAQERQLEGFINERVLKRLGADGSMDGETFKQVESELTHYANNYKSSGDASQRELGKALDDVAGALRDNLERSSSPEAKAQLKQLNTAWAGLRRIETAAANRVGSEGVFTTGDLLSSIKRSDKSVGKRAFARGDAMMQDFAAEAHKVLPNRLPDSGTPERLMFNDPKGLVMTAVRPVTNTVARGVLNRMSGNSPETLGQSFSALPTAARVGGAQAVLNEIGQ